MQVKSLIIILSVALGVVLIGAGVAIAVILANKKKR